MNALQLRDTLVKMLPAGLSAMIKGAPGVGKSDVVAQVAEELKYDLLISHPVVQEPINYIGLPAIVNGCAEFLPFGDLRFLLEAKRPLIAFLDDLGQAPVTVQAAAMQLLLARRINGHKISDHVVFVAATNRRQDRAGVTGILEPVKSRFVSILELNPDVDSWTEWALKNDVPAEVIGFIRFRPNLLHTEEATAEIVNHPCPRTIAHMGKLVRVGITDIETLSGAVGSGCASEFIGFIRVYQDLPDLDEIIDDPKGAKVPTGSAALYAVTAGLVCKLTKANSGAIITYCEKLPSEFSTLLIRDAIRKEPSIQSTKAFNAWATGKHGKNLT